MAFAVGSAANGGILYSDGTIKRPQSSATDSRAANYRPVDRTPVDQPSVPGRSTGSVLGAQSSSNRTSSSGGSGGGEPTPVQAYGRTFEDGSAVKEYESQVRSDINSGYDSYFSELDRQIGGLGTQQKGQEQIVNNNFNQGQTDIYAQRDSSLGDLNTQRRKTQEGQVSSLNDLSANIRNLFQTGNMKLGAMGAGDSSAAGQYSYAVGKLGAKGRGDILSQTRSIENDIADREAKLTNIVTQEIGKLRTNKDNQIIQISQWFQDKQNELGQMKAQGQLQKGQSLASLSMQLLQTAQQRLMQVESDSRSRQQALQQWALNHATTFEQAKQAIGQQGNYQAAGVNSAQVNGRMNVDAGGNYSTYMPGNRYADTTDLKNPFLS